jgi:hypothetical protein
LKNFFFVSFLKFFRFVFKNILFRFVSEKIHFDSLTFFCFKPLKIHIYFIFLTSGVSLLRLLRLRYKTYFQVLQLLFTQKRWKRCILLRKIHFMGLQKDNVSQQSRSNSCARLKKDELDGRIQPLHSYLGYRSVENGNKGNDN